MIRPYKLGLPKRYRRWRPGQELALDAILRSDRRFIPVNAPTGFGKSLLYMAAALAAPDATVLTATKVLQDQLLRDFSEMGLRSVMGMRAPNYECRLDPPTRIEDAVCHYGVKCEFKDQGCEFYDALRAARASSLRLTNYSFHLSRDEEVGVGESSLLICDEVHEALDEVTARQTLQLPGRTLHALRRQGCTVPPLDEPNAHDLEWREWIQAAQLATQRLIASTIGARRSYYRQLRLQIRAFAESTRTGSDQWVLGCDHHGGFSWAPLWPDMSALWRNADQVLLVSATLTKKHLDLFRLPKREVEPMAEYPSPFPVARRPIYYLPTVRMTWRVTNEEIDYWISRMDQLIGERLDRKGLIHAVSYERARLICARSKYRRYMLTHEAGQSRAAVEAFRAMDAPCIFVSPAVSTGVDFPHEDCLYQIIGKIPFPDTRDPLTNARCKSDASYHTHLAAAKLVQMTGRAMRAADDYCETFILDDQARWFVWKGKEEGVFPDYWLRAYYRKDRIPKPLPLDDVRNP